MKTQNDILAELQEELDRHNGLEATESCPICNRIKGNIEGVKKEKTWRKKMQDKPCYLPALPFYDVCLNANQEVKRYDCNKCTEEKELKDYIE